MTSQRLFDSLVRLTTHPVKKATEHLGHNTFINRLLTFATAGYIVCNENFLLMTN